MSLPFSILLTVWTTLVVSHAQGQSTPNAETLATEQRRIDAIEQASATTITIFESSGMGGGSGVLISADGFALTNFHVAAPCGTAMKCGMDDGKLYDAVIVGIDPVGDVALIQLLGRDDFPHATLGDSDEVNVGDWVFVAGNPFLLANDFTPSVSYGIVSGVRRYQYPAGTLLEYTDCIQTDAAINPGNSGGPLFDAEGMLIGINGRGSFEKRGRVNVGVGYAISINQIKMFLSHLKSGRIVDHATLGATVATEEDGRVMVDEILEASDAYRRGLRYGDEIIHFASREIASANQLKNALGIFPRGWTVPMTFLRNGSVHSTRVRLLGLHDQAQLFDMVGQQAAKPVEPPEGDRPRRNEEDQQQPRSKPHLPFSIVQQPELPKSIAERFEARRGFANYWYNLQEQRALWETYCEQSPLTTAGYNWQLRGQMDQSKSMSAQLTREGATLKSSRGNFAASFVGNLEEQLSPPRSGGLLLTLHLWQRLLDKGLRQFGEVYYLGQLPLGPDGEWSECLWGIYAGMEIAFYFSTDSRDLIGIEVFPTEEADPCLLMLTDYGDLTGSRLPLHWHVWHGDRKFAELRIEGWEFDATTAGAKN